MTVQQSLRGTKVQLEKYPSLQKFLIESALYEHVGLNFETLKSRPFTEVLDYVTIADLIAKERIYQQKKHAAEAARKK
jgi:hypothetical protein